jgi:hypothetical protein
MASLDNVDSVRDLESEQYIDSRDMESRIDELEAIEEARKDWEELTAEEREEADDEPEELDDDAKALLAALREVRDACGREWRHGVQYIREDAFEDHAQQLAEDIGAIPDNAQWPCTCIDWEEAASQLKQDYSSIEIGESTFYYRD